MALAPRPVVLTQRAAVAGELAPEPVVVVGSLPAASATVAGGVKKGATVAAATVATDGTSVGTQFNALLVSLKAAGIIA